MRMTVIMLTAFLLQASAKSFSQKITFTGKEVSLEKIFSVIENQTGYVVFYNYSVIRDARLVNVRAKETPLEQFLLDCFSNQELKYVIEGKTILVTRKEPEQAAAAASSPPTEIHGRVLDESGQPLAGASISILPSGKSTITDAKGNFELHNVKEGSSIQISFIGYTSRTIHITGNDPVQVTLFVAVNELDRVLVQAYGTTSQRFSTGNIGKVTADEIQRQPVMNPLLALQGKVPGLSVTQTSGYASAPVKVELRGRSAISDAIHSDPLYIIDGVPLNYVALNDGYYLYGSPGFIQNGFAGPAGGQSPLFNLNPSDIESIEVLKDADATAIYGSRGANGVILITTKKGKPGRMKGDINVQEGVNYVTRYYQMMNTRQYVEMRREAFKNSGTSPDPVADYDINGTWDTTRYTDWQHTLYGHTGNSFSAQGGISGGSNQTNFRIGGNYARSTNILTVSGADQKAGVSLNVSQKSADQRFSASLSVEYTSSISNMITIPTAVVAYAPNTPAIYDAKGNLNYAGWGGTDDNSYARGAYPFSALRQPYTSRTSFLNSSLVLNYQLLKGLALTANIGYNSALVNQNYVEPISSQDPEQSPTGTHIWGYNNNRNWIIEPQLNYGMIIGNGKLSVLAGASLQNTKTEGLTVNGSGYLSDDLLYSLSNAPRLTSNEFYGEYRYAAVFSRITYNWKNKYILNLNGRRDGSSRFGPGNQYGNFGSVGGAWIFTEEPFIKKHLALLSFGKIRGSYGTTGSDGVGDYKYLSQYASGLNNYPYGGIPTLHPTILGNPDFQWQVNKKLEVAINLGFLKDRLNVQVAYYRNRCGNQLIGYPLPLFTGFPSVTANSVALVQNSGLEYSFSFKVIEGSKFSWSVNANVSTNRNKLISYPNLQLSPFYGYYIVGKSLNIQRIVHYTGVDPLTGNYTFADKNHDGQVTINYNGTPDDSDPVDISPKYSGGVGVDFTCRNFTLNLFFNFVKQLGRNAYLGGNIPGTLNSNMPVQLLDRWQKPGDQKPYAAYLFNPNSSTYYYFFNASDGVYTDASFIRLSNTSLSYAIPEAALKRIHIQGFRIFVNANNLLTITGYKGIDPEVQNFTGSMPPTRTIVAGISLNL